MGGRQGSGGSAPWRAATPTTSTSSRASRVRASSIAATAVPPGTGCQHCSRVSATLTAYTPDDVARRDCLLSRGERALVTGIGGQDGSYLAELLLDHGYE